MGRWGVGLALFGLGCSGDDPKECEDGQATCVSSLIVNLPDDRTAFSLTLNDDQGLDITFDCPDQDTGLDSSGVYTWVCGTGRATIETYVPFGDTVFVQLGSAPARDFMPEWSRGGDFCGNVCMTGSLDL